MTNTISISSKPGNKSFVGNIRLCDLEERDNAKLTEDDWLWPGESAFCICTHHVEHHFTVHDNIGRVIEIYCLGRYEDGELCNCVLFRTRSIRIDQGSFRSDVDEMTEEDLANV